MVAVLAKQPRLTLGPGFEFSWFGPWRRGAGNSMMPAPFSLLHNETDYQRPVGISRNFHNRRHHRPISLSSRVVLAARAVSMAPFQLFARRPTTCLYGGLFPMAMGVWWSLRDLPSPPPLRARLLGPRLSVASALLTYHVSRTRVY